MRCATVATVAGMAVLLLVTPALAQTPDLAGLDPKAEAHLRRGAAHYAAKEYEAAITEFRQGYAIEPTREFLFAWAQAERLRGNCRAAVPLYRKVLRAGPSRSQADVATFHLRRCEALLPAPWYHDVLGDVLVVSGAIGLSVGLGFYAASIKSEDAASGAESYREYDSLIDKARSRRAIAWIGIGAGSALALGGIARYVWHRQPSGRAELNVSLGTGELGLALTTRF